MLFIITRALRALPSVIGPMIAGNPAAYRRRSAIKRKAILMIAALLLVGMTFSVLAQGAVGRIEDPMSMWFLLLKVIIMWTLLLMAYTFLMAWIKTKRHQIKAAWRAHGRRGRTQTQNQGSHADPFQVSRRASAGFDARAGFDVNDAGPVFDITTLRTPAQREQARRDRATAGLGHLDVTDEHGQAKGFFDPATGYAPSRFPSTYEQTKAMLDAAKAARRASNAGAIDDGRTISI